MAGTGGKRPNAGRNPIGINPRKMFGTRLDLETIQEIDAMANRLGNRAVAIDAIVDYLKVNDFAREVLPMGQNVPRVAELPPSMGFSSAAVRLLDRVMEKLNLESQEDAVNAVCAFLRDRDMVDGILEAMAGREGS